MPTSPILSPRHRRSLVALALLVTSLWAVTAATAQEGDQERSDPVTWGISPAAATGRDTRSVIDHVVEPGETVIEHVVVDNYGEEPLTVDLYASDARPANGAFDVDAADEPAEAVGAWTALDQTTIEIGARDHAIVPLTIRVPADAPPGDHAGGVLASRRTAGVGDEVGIETERRVGARIYLRVAGPIRPALTVADLEASYDHQLDPIGRGDITVTYRITNTGNIRLAGETQITMTGPFGLGRRTIEGPPVDDLLPGHGIDQHLTIDQALPLGRLTIEAEVTPTHSISQPLGDTIDPDHAAVRLWAIPFTALAGLVALLLLGWLLRRRHRSRSAGAGSVAHDRPAVEPTIERAAHGGDRSQVRHGSPSPGTGRTPGTLRANAPSSGSSGA